MSGSLVVAAIIELRRRMRKLDLCLDQLCHDTHRVAGGRVQDGEEAAAEEHKLGAKRRICAAAEERRVEVEWFAEREMMLGIGAGFMCVG